MYIHKTNGRIDERSNDLPASWRNVSNPTWEYLKAKGWEIEEEPGPELIIYDVTPRQIRLKLLSIGITSAQIEALINTLPSPDKDAAMIAWEYSTSFQRNNQFVPIIGKMLNYTSDQLDQMWTEAKLL